MADDNRVQEFVDIECPEYIDGDQLEALRSAYARQAAVGYSELSADEKALVEPLNEYMKIFRAAKTRLARDGHTANLTDAERDVMLPFLSCETSRELEIQLQVECMKVAIEMCQRTHT